MPHHDDMTQDVKTKVQELGNDAANAARHKVEETAEAAQTRAVDEISQAANAADAAASEFDPGSLQAQVAQQVAAGAEHFAQSVANMDVNALTRDASDFARRNPLLFIGGAVLVGIAAARFLKARDPNPIAQTYADDDPWQSRTAQSPTGGYDVPS